MAQHARPLPSLPTPGLVLPPAAAPTGTSDPTPGGDARTAPRESPPRVDPPVHRDAVPDAAAAVERVERVPRATPGAPAEQPLPWYRAEAWLAICAVALVPLGLALVVPRPGRIPLLALSGALIVAAVLALLRQETRRQAGP